MLIHTISYPCLSHVHTLVHRLLHDLTLVSPQGQIVLYPNASPGPQFPSPIVLVFPPGLPVLPASLLEAFLPSNPTVSSHIIQDCTLCRLSRVISGEDKTRQVRGIQRGDKTKRWQTGAFFRSPPIKRDSKGRHISWFKSKGLFSLEDRAHRSFRYQKELFASHYSVLIT